MSSNALGVPVERDVNVKSSRKVQYIQLSHQYRKRQRGINLLEIHATIKSVRTSNDTSALSGEHQRSRNTVWVKPRVYSGAGRRCSPHFQGKRRVPHSQSPRQKESSYSFMCFLTGTLILFDNGFCS